MVGSPAFQLCIKLGATHSALQKWSKATVGFLPNKIRLLHHKLQALENLPSTDLSEDARSALRFELQTVMTQEEDLRKSKSKIQWLATSDLNT